MHEAVVDAVLRGERGGSAAQQRREEEQRQRHHPHAHGPVAVAELAVPDGQHADPARVAELRRHIHREHARGHQVHQHRDKRRLPRHAAAPVRRAARSDPGDLPQLRDRVGRVAPVDEQQRDGDQRGGQRRLGDGYGRAVEEDQFVQQAVEPLQDG